jgi:2-iminobutanoate/2-iminopropanoate deaminase
VTSGTPGLSTDGEAPRDIVGQAEIVKVTPYLTRAQDIQAYAALRSRFFKGARPASMLLVLPALLRPEFLVEVEVIAARQDRSA